MLSKAMLVIVLLTSVRGSMPGNLVHTKGKSHARHDNVHLIGHHRRPPLVVSSRAISRPSTALSMHPLPNTKLHAPAPRPLEPTARVFSRVLLSIQEFQCSACQEGTYCYENFLTRCPAHSHSENQSDAVEDCLCKAGFYQNASFSSGGACLPCRPSFFCEGRGGATACHEHALSAAGSYTSSQCLCAAGYAQVAAGNCTACALGTYKTEWGTAACSPCAEATYAPAAASVSCTECPAYTVSNAGSWELGACVAQQGAYGAPGNEATLCPAGFFADQRNSSACVACSSFSYLAAVGSRSSEDCLACPANSAVFANVNTTSPNGVGTDAALCVCMPGFERVGGLCLACGAGAYKAAPGNHACGACPPDTFASPSNTECSPCVQFSSSSAGSESASNCSCDPGYAAMVSGIPSASAVECVACEPGSYKDELRNTACSACAPGFYQLLRASTHCEECTPNNYVRADGNCVSCGAHEHAPARSSTSTACTCDAGYARTALAPYGIFMENKPNGDDDSDGDADCRPCPLGYFRSSDADDHTCSACPAGHVSHAAASTEHFDCVACGRAAYVALTVNGSFCRPCTQHANSSDLSVGIGSCLCDAGYFRAAEHWDGDPTIEHVQALEAALLCTQCPSGKFKATPGNQPCTLCPAGTTGATFEISATLRADESACAPCSPNTYSTLLYAPDAGGDVFQCAACPTDALSSASSTSVGNCSCSSGFSFASTGSPCEACEPGKFKRHVANTHCAPCATGSYALGAASLCTQCPANSTTAEPGALNSSACVCLPGYFASENRACVLCPSGSFSETLGASKCENCGTRAFLSPLAAPGVGACVACPANSRAVPPALGVGACVGLPGWQRVGSNKTHVELQLAVAFSAARVWFFQGQITPYLRAAIAAVARVGCSCVVSSADVAVTHVSNASAVGPARRLLQESTDGILVSVAILMPSEEAGSVLVQSGALNVSDLNEAYSEEISGLSPALSTSIIAITEPPTLMTGGFFFVVCPADSYCPDENTVVNCPPDSFAITGAVSIEDCKCRAGGYGVRGNCSVCPVDFWCPEASSAPSSCLAYSSTNGEVAADDSEDCECAPGRYRTPDLSECRICPENTYCYGAQADASPCPANSSALPGTTSIEQCTCHAGMRLQHRPEFANIGLHLTYECVPCASSSVCHGGGEIEHCVENATSSNFVCRCAAGMYCSAPNTSFEFGPSCSGSSKCQACVRGHYCNGITETACGAGEDSLERSSDNSACRCKPGYYRVAHRLCAICTFGFVCPGGMPDRPPLSQSDVRVLLHQNEARMATTLFDPHLTTLDADTTDISFAVCEAGYFRTARIDSCKLCPKNFWCPPEQANSVLPNVIACLENEVTEEAGAFTAEECFCAVGFKLAPQDSAVRCLACQAGERCQAGQVVEAQCHAMNRVPNADHSKCVCAVGHGEYTLECKICPPGSSKPFIGDKPCAFCLRDEYIVDARGPCLPCPAHANSRPGSHTCTCQAPYVLRESVNASLCVLCDDNFYWASLVTPVHSAMSIGLGAPPGLCLPCPVNSFGNASTTMSLGIQHCKCASGSSALPRLPYNISTRSANASSLNYLLMCMPCNTGEFEDQGVCRICPPHSSSLPGSVALWQCTCNISSCHTQRVDGSCAGRCADTPSACNACQPGFHKPSFSSPGNSEACSECVVGKFQASEAALECETCPAHRSTVLPGRQALSECQCVAGWTPAGAVSCDACLPGHFKNLIGDEPCEVCGIGRYQPASNSSSCYACVDATTSLDAFARAFALEGGNSTHDIHPVLASNSTQLESSVSVLECVCTAGNEPRVVLNESIKRCQSCQVGSFKPLVGLEACFYCGRQDIPDIGGNGISRYGNESFPVDDFEHCILCPPYSGQDAGLVGPALIMDGLNACKCFPGHEKRTTLGCSICSPYMHQPQYSDADCHFCADGHYFVERQYTCQLCDIRDEDNHSPHQGHVTNSINLRCDLAPAASLRATPAHIH